jgi:DHA3 family macrolide efflux protein-like MFS transporter
VAGALVDRWNRRAIMIVADSLIALVTLGLILLYAAGRMQVWHVYVAMFLRAALGGFHWPAMQSSTSLMVPKEQLTRVAGLNQTLMGIMNIISPPLGALLLSVLPLSKVLAVDVVTAVLAVTPLLFLTIPQPAPIADPAAAGAVRASVWSDLRAGFKYVMGWPGLLAILVMAMVINFVVDPAFSLMPILVTEYFGLGALQLGWLESVWGIGVVTGGLVLSAWGGFKRRVVTSLLGIIGMGIGTLIVGVSPVGAFMMALAGMLVAGFMNPIVNGPFMAVMQTNVAPEMQGRVFSLIQSASLAMMPLSLLIAGPIADTFGVRVWYVAGGALCILIGLIAFTVPAIMHVEENGHAPLSPASTLGETAAAPVVLPVE